MSTHHHHATIPSTHRNHKLTTNGSTRGSFLLLCLLFFSISTFTLLLPSNAAVQPPYTGEPNYAYVQMEMIEISKIDGVEQAFHADFYMLTTWAAPLAGTPFNGTEPLSSSELEQYFWSPQLEFVNVRDDVHRLSDEPYSFAKRLVFNISSVNPGYVLPPGWVWIIEDQRYICDFKTDLGMQDFPFDSQYMQFFIESFAWTYDIVRIRWAIPEAIQDLVPDDLTIVGWTFVSSEQEEAPAPGVVYRYNREAFARLTVRALLDRLPHYYLIRVAAGVMMLVYMCIWIFSLSVDQAARQLGTLHIFASLVTFLFVVSSDTPKVPYQTRLDIFMLWSFFNVGFMLFIHGSLYYWRECDVEDLLEERERARLERQKEREEEEDENSGNITPLMKSHSSVDVSRVGFPSSSSGIELNHNHNNHSYASAVTAAETTSGHDDHATFADIGARRTSGIRRSSDISRTSVSINTSASALHHHPHLLPSPSMIVQKGPVSYMPVKRVNHTTWRLREDSWHDWTLRKWYNGLHATRKWDAVIVPFLFVQYSVGVAIILGRPASSTGTRN